MGDAPPAEGGRGHRTIPVPEFDALHAAIGQNLAAALQVTNHVFRKAILDEMNAFRLQTGSWQKHQIEAVGEQYNWVLIQLYESAKTTVFSTSMPEYLGTWNRPLGEKLLNAHAKSDAHVTRVFIFNHRSEISDEAVAVMKRLSNSAARDKMTVSIWIDDEDPAFQFPTPLSRDFTIIDNGAAIGITVKLSGQDLSAQWHFDSPDFTAICREVADRLNKGAVRFPQFLADWERRKQP